MSAFLQQMWLYNDWANSLLFDHLNSSDTSLSSLRLLSHIVNAQAHWLNRIKGTPSMVQIGEEHDLAYCKRLHDQVSQELQQFVTDEPKQLSSIIEYQNSNQQRFKNSLEDILIHLFNHGTYHRAQIAMDLRQHGLEPIKTDYINFVR